MTGQNTQKQIMVMVVLMFLGVVGLGAYVWFDDGRRVEAQDKLLIENAERGAEIFALNCRVCHGNAGLGNVGNPSLLGPALNKPANTLAFRSANIGGLGLIQSRFHDTVSCGRNGTPMPSWAISQGGSLSDFKIGTLVALSQPTPATPGNRPWRRRSSKTKSFSKGCTAPSKTPSLRATKKMSRSLKTISRRRKRASRRGFPSTHQPPRSPRAAAGSANPLRRDRSNDESLR